MCRPKAGDRFILLAPLVIMTLVAVAVRGPAGAATATSGASAVIVGDLSVHKEANLNFGKLKGGLSDGTVVVTTDYTRYVTGGAKIFKNSSFHPAKFLVLGNPGAGYDITLPTSVAFHRHNKNKPMPKFSSLEVIDFSTYSEGAMSGGGGGIIGGDGKDYFYVGGTLNVPKKAKTGEYRGMLVVEVTYQ